MGWWSWGLSYQEPKWQCQVRASAFRFPSLLLFPRRNVCYFEVPCFSVFPLFRVYLFTYLFWCSGFKQGIRHARQMPYHWAHRSLPLTRDNGAWSWAELSFISQNSHARISTAGGGACNCSWSLRPLSGTVAAPHGQAFWLSMTQGNFPQEVCKDTEIVCCI